MKRCCAIIVAVLLLFPGCQKRDGQAAVLKQKEDLNTHIGKQCSVEGVATDRRKGFLSIVSNDGTEWFVALSTMGSWPAGLAGKVVRVTGTAPEYQPRLNANGEPVDDSGQLVAGYSIPVFYLKDCVVEQVQ